MMSMSYHIGARKMKVKGSIFCLTWVYDRSCEDGGSDGRHPDPLLAPVRLLSLAWLPPRRRLPRTSPRSHRSEMVPWWRQADAVTEWCHRQSSLSQHCPPLNLTSQTAGFRSFVCSQDLRRLVIKVPTLYHPWISCSLLDIVITLR